MLPIRLHIEPEPDPRFWAPRLTAARDRFVDRHALSASERREPSRRLPADLSFFELPEQMLLAYGRHRESSELGHIFRIANGLHDHIDAAVVTGPAQAILAARVLASGCGDPFHNELSRAERGSKPRIYFCDDFLDNDRLQSLLKRIRMGGYGDGQAERHWSLIAVQSDRDADRRDAPDASYAPVLATLRRQLARSVQQWPEDRPKPLTHIRRIRSGVMEMFGDPESSEILRVPDTIDPRLAALSPIGLLPAALLGLDCIALLAGAAAVSENFRQAAFEDNQVLRYLAAQLADLPGPGHGDRGGAPVVPFACLGPLSDWLAAIAVPGVDRSRQAVVVAVDRVRTDPLVTETAGRSGGVNWTVADLQHLVEIGRSQRRALRGQREIRWQLPVIDTSTLGQLMQLQMITSALAQSLGRQSLGGTSVAWD